MDKKTREKAKTLLSRVVNDLHTASANINEYASETPDSPFKAVALLAVKNNRIDIERIEEVLALIG